MNVNFFDILKKVIKLLVYAIIVAMGLLFVVVFVMYHDPLWGIFLIPVAVIVFIGLIIDKLFFNS
ncbi:MAG: hypothetical protein B6I20_05565 [Bacteroidetes bacterium 4572_117]|nr:MAG: hypothetical protein B6I20_05565 [Bacteroidetes bacterium 4572_117]